jgi:hypothetical protein
MQQPNNKSSASTRYNPNGTVNNSYLAGGSISPGIGGRLPPELVSLNIGGGSGEPSAFN